ncbi:MAG: molybdopterin-dependent oxidoreductase [Lewinellaceae bacterium]|nr:molybdopterin-dependent oxidoreductase [Lewinellaceae bacterium]
MEPDPQEHRGGISRRKFIHLGLHSYAGFQLAPPLLGSLAFLEACSTPVKTIHGACYHDCPDTCSWTVTTQGEKVTGFGPNSANPYTGNSLCSKMNFFPQEVTFHPDRILTPLKRVGPKGKGTFAPISWEQALTEVATKLSTIIQEKGGEAVMPYSFAGTEGLVQNNAMGSRFFARIGATRLARTICGDAAFAGVNAVNGGSTGVLPQDIIHSRYIIFWGTNPVLSNQHLWSLAQQARKQGAKLVVIDPFLSQTAAQADWHIQLYPGTDTALALALINVILAEELYDQAYVDKFTTGIAELRTHVAAYAPDTVAAITGVDAAVIQQLAREYAQGNPALIRVLIGMEHQANGASAFQAVAMLPALTGAWQQLGGGLLHFTFDLFGEALNWERITLGDTLQNPATRTVNMVQIGRALTDPALSPAIHALFVYNSNPAVIAPNQNLVRQGLEREDLLTVVLEHFLTDTARYADYVFPATSQLEHWDLLTSWGQTYINLNQPAIPPLGEAKPNSEFFRLLAAAMGFTEEYFGESDVEIIKKTLDSKHPYMAGITFDYLQEKGWAELQLPRPWLPFAEGNFATPSGKCEFVSSQLTAQGLPGLPAYRPVAYSEEEIKTYPLHCLTIKSTCGFLNSSHANVDRLRKEEGGPVLDIHQQDAAARGIVDGDSVKVFNANGVVSATARIRRKVKPGVVCLPQGFWSSLVAGNASANALTNDCLTDMGEGAALQENRVQVAKG